MQLCLTALRTCACAALLPHQLCPRAPPAAWGQVHEETIAHGAYPSPYNYYSYPKSVCTSINEVRHRWTCKGNYCTLLCFRMLHSQSLWIN